LPYGFGFDYVIQERADKINNQKFKNNKLMDQLVEKLGYLDYRDALAANKYILEAKRHGDYHQQARAKTLALALDRMTKLKREQIEKEAHEIVRKSGNKEQGKQFLDMKEQKKLELIMNQDAAMSHVYQTFLGDVKESSEREINDLK
jgi:hypothetical protein